MLLYPTKFYLFHNEQKLGAYYSDDCLNIVWKILFVICLSDIILEEFNNRYFKGAICISNIVKLNRVMYIQRHVSVYILVFQKLSNVFQNGNLYFENHQMYFINGLSETFIVI